MKSPYEVLGVPRDGDDATIKKAFRRLARTYYPDIPSTGDRARVVDIESAYQTLSDPGKRAAYDAPPTARPAESGAAPASSPFVVTVAIPIPRSPEEMIEIVDRLVADPKQAVRDAANVKFGPKGSRVVDALFQLFKD